MDTISGKLAAVALALGLLVTSVANPAHAQAPADLAREWSAVQAVLPPGIDAQALLYPAMNATGTLAIQQAAVLDLSPDAYLLAQQHPVQLMDAIQHALHRFDQGAAGIYVAESLCDQVDLLNFNGLTAAQEAQLVALLASEPLASTRLAPSAPAVPAM